MVAADFFNLLQTFDYVSSVGLEDYADKFCYLISTVVLVICVFIVTLKLYIFEPLSCFIATPLKGPNVEEYINSYCWINGTLPLKWDLDLVSDDEVWRKLEPTKMNYYQWVPLVLALQAILCYLPKLLWQSFTFNRVGMDLNHILGSGKTALHQMGEDRIQTVSHIARTIESLLFSRRSIHHNKITQIRQKWWMSWLPGKRLGTALVIYYQLIKLMYLLNAVGQIFMMQRFLNLGGNYTYFGPKILSDLLSGRNWKETQIFPRIGYCRVDFAVVGSVNKVVAQCTLPINMLNEKVYVFLWFWFSLVAALQIISITSWILRLVRRRKRLHNIIRYLKISNSYRPEQFPIICHFERDFLKMDGSFLVYMLNNNCGEIITKEIVEAMVKHYFEEYKATESFQNNIDENMRKDQPEKLYPGLIHADDSSSTAFRRDVHSEDNEEFV